MDDSSHTGARPPDAEAQTRMRAEAARTGAQQARPRIPTGGAGDDVFADPRAWAALSEAKDAAGFLAAWLALQCRMIAGATQAALFIRPDEGGFVPAAVWPAPDFDLTPMQEAAEIAARSGAAHLQRDGEPADGAPPTGGEKNGGEKNGDESTGGGTSAARPGALLAFPVLRERRVEIVVTLRLDAAGARAMRGAWRRLHWGSGWLAAHLAGLAALDARTFVSRAETALDLLALSNEHVRHDAAAMAIVNELQTTLGVANAAIGLTRGRGANARIELLAISRAAWFQRRAKLIGELENAMGEALDQGCVIAWPQQGEAAGKRIAVAHRAYARAADMGAVASFVMIDQDGPCGALALEKRDDAPWSPEVLALGETLAAMIGPALILKRRQRRWVSGRIADWIGDAVKALVGHRKPSLKIAAVLGIAGLAFIAFVDGDFRVSADAVLEGAVQRAAAAPFDGFLKQAQARAGDIVKQGDTLAELDDRDLKLDLQRWKSEYAQLRQQQRAAMAGLDRSEVALLAAQIEQARAQLDLAQAKLARTRIEAPIDGVVIAGDLSQKLGSPVSMGDVLFEIAPLQDYRVVIQVSEGDLRYVKPGQSGELLLAGRADAALPLSVTRVTSVAAVADGRNAFRVEAALAEAAPAIRPGMEGVAKIDVEPRPYIWIWTRPMIDWLRVFVWKWTP